MDPLLALYDADDLGGYLLQSFVDCPPGYRAPWSGVLYWSLPKLILKPEMMTCCKDIIYSDLLSFDQRDPNDKERATNHHVDETVDRRKQIYISLRSKEQAFEIMTYHIDDYGPLHNNEQIDLPISCSTTEFYESILVALGRSHINQ